MESKSFFAGFEEVLGRFVGFIITLIFFGIYNGASSEVEITFRSGFTYLAIFWFVYELVGYTFFKLFRYFATTRKDKSMATGNLDLDPEGDDFHPIIQDQGNPSEERDS